uniref:Integrase catalytic domain-containing protein n=1 Tax=Anopheles minimus TaxID=112268 RepID=A0A182VT46_9DIPT
MKHSLVEELGVSGTLRPLCLKWTGGQHRYENKSMDVSMGISGIRGNDHVYEIAVRTVHRLGLPAQRIKPNELRAAYKHLSSVPFSSYRDTPPKLLIGMNNYHITVPLKTVEGPANEPIATKTRLGWTISGCISPQVVSDKAKVIAAHFIEICQCQNIDTKIDAALKGGIERFSRWRRLQRAVAYVWRFINNARQPKASRIKGPLTHLELQQAERTVLIQAQRQEYPDEYRTLQEGVANTKTRRIYLKKSSPLFRRSPYLDEDGVIRLHGRIDACQHISDEMKRPIILPKTGHLTDLIIDDYHRRYQHANHQTVMNEVRQKFDVPALRSACHRIRNNCAKCKIRIATPTVPMMCELPAARLSPFCRPFSFTGIDYFGPFLVAVGRRQEKRWGVLFTCLTIRAIHIEVASSLSTSSCIIALRNFIARRGTPLEIYSDRGTNFIGANRELKEAMAKINTNELIEVMHLPDTKWNFNPPAAPHFGGAWERLVQTVKRTLNNMQFTRTPSDAVFTNWLIEVEMIVNSRPLTQVPVENEEEAPLTPNHFILGSSAGTKPLSILDDSTACLRNNWKASQSYANVFWRKWVASYLPTLTRRSKWFQTQRTLKEDDLVLIVDDNLPRGCWPKGRVVRTVPSKDGEIRQVHVKLANGKVLERP